MKADTVALVQIFGTDKRHVVPLFQRPYVWTQDDNWDPLWRDVRSAAEEVEVLRAGAVQDSSRVARTHFLGAVVLERLPVAPGRIVAMNVIDGQQRLTTLQALVVACWAAARRHSAANAEALLRMLLNNTEQLIHPDHPYERYKVWPSLPDRDAFREIFAAELQPERADEHLLLQARRYFDGEVEEWLSAAEDPAARADALVIALRERLGLVEIQLEEHDDAQIIFETLNDRGTRLRASDLVKNTLFRMAEQNGEDVNALYNRFWSPFENSAWWRAEVTTGRIKRARLDQFLSYWLTICTGVEVPVERLFTDFRAWLRRSQRTATEVLADLARYAFAYQQMYTAGATDPTGRFLQVLELLKTTTPIPLLLQLQGRPGVPVAQRGLAAAALESYLVRRLACGLTSKDYNRLLLVVLQQVRQAPDETAGTRVVEVLAEQGAESRYWPDDAEFVDALMSPNIYRSLRGPRLRILLGGIEAELRRTKSEMLFTPVHVDKLSVEHLLPQSWSQYYPLPTDQPYEEAKQRREGAIHRLGNLTLTTTKLNSSVSNGSWPTKRSELRKNSVLLLTSGSVLDAPDGAPSALAMAWQDAWDENRIELRGLYLASVACRAWPGPKDSCAAG